MRLHTKISLVKSTIRILIGTVSEIILIRTSIDSPLFLPLTIFIVGNVLAEIIAILEETDDKW